MCDDKKEQGQPEMTVSELLSAISENEYPQYILEAVNVVREWMSEAAENEGNADDYDEDIFSAIFGESYDDDSGGLDKLIERLEALGGNADILPNVKRPEGKSDAIIVSITPPDYESGLRTAIDYAAVFNRGKCRRVWIISDTFVLDEVMKFSAHVDALAEQGITLRYILVTPWGWVELPLSGMTAERHGFLWRNEGLPDERKGHKRRKQ